MTETQPSVIQKGGLDYGHLGALPLVFVSEVASRLFRRLLYVVP